MKALLLILTLFFLSGASAQFVPITMWRKYKAFFVLTKGTHTGNFGGLAGADQFCLSDLQSYDWKGKAEAGPLNSSRVKAFLCDDNTCARLLPNMTYTFAKANSLTAGGATFTTDSNGAGPGNTNRWTGVTYFDLATTTFYWTGARSSFSDSLWEENIVANGDSCLNWTSTSAIEGGNVGDPNVTTKWRWNDELPRGCDNTYALTCIVNP